jgi:hypothetical protein
MAISEKRMSQQNLCLCFVEPPRRPPHSLAFKSALSIVFLNTIPFDLEDVAKTTEL